MMAVKQYHVVQFLATRSHHDISDHWQLNCLLNSFFRLITKKIPNPHTLSLCGTSNVEGISMSWHNWGVGGGGSNAALSSPQSELTSELKLFFNLFITRPQWVKLPHHVSSVFIRSVRTWHCVGTWQSSISMTTSYHGYQLYIKTGTSHISTSKTITSTALRTSQDSENSVNCK